MNRYFYLGQQIIKFVRQECCFKYGSGVLKQTKARKISQYFDQERMFIARHKIQRFRMFLQIKKGKIKQQQYISLFNQIQAANCGEMALLTFNILKRMLTPGILIEYRVALHQNIRFNHCFVAVKPLNLVQDHQTLIIDPWPANQLINPKVVLKENHYCSKIPYLVNESYYIKECQKHLQPIQLQNFHKKQFQKIRFQTKKQNQLKDPDWIAIKKLPFGDENFDFMDIVVNQEYYAIFKKGRLQQDQVEIQK